MGQGFEMKTEAIDHPDTYNTGTENMIQSTIKEEKEASSMKTEGMDYEQVTQMMEPPPSVKEDTEITDLIIESYCSLTSDKILDQTCRMQNIKTEKVDLDIQNCSIASIILPQTGLCKMNTAHVMGNSTDVSESQHVADKCFVVKAETGEICCEIDMSSKESILKSEHLKAGETQNKHQMKQLLKCGECEYSSTERKYLTRHKKNTHWRETI